MIPIVYGYVGCVKQALLVILDGAALQYERLVAYGGQYKGHEAQFLRRSGTDTNINVLVSICATFSIFGDI